MRVWCQQVSLFCDAALFATGSQFSLMYNSRVRTEESTVKKYILAFIGALVLSACSGPEDVLETIGDVSVPDQLTGCVARDDEGSCIKAVCVADEESDCKDFVKACEKHDHIVDVRDGHDTCERATSPES